jgi:Tfp pilus assembly protein PilF
MTRWQCGVLAGAMGLAASTAVQAVPPATMSAVTGSEMTPAQSLQLCLDLAASLERVEKYKDAMAQYERALAIDPNNHQANRRLAVLCSKVGQYDRADLCFQKAVQGEPKNANVYNDWGRSYYLRGNWTAADKMFRAALQIEPRHRLAVNNLALTLGQQKRYAEAFQIFRNGGLSDAQAHCNIGYILLSQGRTEEARKACTLAKQLDPSCAKAEELLAQLGPAPQPEIEKVSCEAPAGSAASCTTTTMPAAVS